MSKKAKVFIGIAVAVLIPLSLFILAKQMSKDRVLLPSRYNVSNILDNNDTIYQQLSDIKLVNQLEDTVSIINSQRGKSLIISIFDLSKNQLLIDSTERNIRVMQKSFLKKMPEKFHFISIIKNDAQADIRAMSDRVKADHDRWWFLKGNAEDIGHFVKKIEPQNPTLKTEFLSEKTVPMILVDTALHFRGYYNALDPTSLKKCADDAILIMLEKKKRK